MSSDAKAVELLSRAMASTGLVPASKIRDLTAALLGSSYAREAFELSRPGPGPGPAPAENARTAALEALNTGEEGPARPPARPGPAAGVAALHAAAQKGEGEDFLLVADRLLEDAYFILEERFPIYGDGKQSARDAATLQSGVLSAYLGEGVAIPSWVFLLTQAASKIQRAARSEELLDDDFVDAINYIVLAYFVRSTEGK